MCIINMRLYVFVFLYGCEMMDVDGTFFQASGFACFANPRTVLWQVSEACSKPGRKKKGSRGQIGRRGKSQTGQREYPKPAQFPKNRTNCSNKKTLDLLDLVSFWGYFHYIEIHDLQYHCKNLWKEEKLAQKAMDQLLREEEMKEIFHEHWPEMHCQHNSASNTCLPHFLRRILAGFSKEIIILRPRMHAFEIGKCSQTFLADISPSNVDQCLRFIYIRCTWYGI